LEISKKTLEEQFLETLPTDYATLAPEHQLALKNLQARKQIVELKEEKKINIEITPLGKEIVKSKLSTQDLIEQITPEILKKNQVGKAKNSEDMMLHLLFQR
jgi:hypothetical protein